MTMSARQVGRARELFSLGIALGTTIGVLSVLPHFLGAVDPPRWSTLPWTHLPDTMVIVLHQVGRILPWIAAGVFWALATSIGWRLQKWLSGPTGENGSRLSFDSLSLLVSVVAISFTNNYLHKLPNALSMDGATSFPVMQWLFLALIAVIAVLGAVIAWWLTRRATSHPAAALAAFTLACYLPQAILKARGDAWVTGVFSKRPMLGATAVSVGTATVFLIAFLFLAGLPLILARASEHYELVLRRLASRRANRLAFLCAGGAILVLPTLSVLTRLVTAPQRPTASAPNIVLIVADTLRADHLGVYDYLRPTSPNLDAWAEGGVVFQRAYSTSSYTPPGVAGIMTSRFPSELGIVSINSHLPDDVPTLAQVLSDRGFLTAAFIGNYVLRRKTGFYRGFQVYDDYFPETEAVRGLPERVAQQVTDATIGWLDHARRDRPFFLWVHYQDPHGPYLPPPGFSQNFRAADYQARHVELAQIPSYQLADGLVQAASFLAGYDNEILYLDGHLGRLLRRIQEEGAVRPTFVVLTADHGEILDEPQPWNFAHGKSLSEEEVRVPLVFFGPGIAGGRHLAGPVSTLDVAPTLLAIAGIASENDWKGENLLPVLTSQENLDLNRVVMSELNGIGDLNLAAWSVDGTGRSRLHIAPDGSILSSLESEDSLAEPLSMALAAHSRLVERHGRRGVTRLPLTRAEEERLRALGYVE